MQSAKLIINELKPQTALLYKRQKHRPTIYSTVLRYPHKTSTLRSNRNILLRQDNTLKSTEIISFRQSQSVDNQCLFFCQNVTSFTGKEKDSETGFYYFGARYYDPALSGLFISVDPMSDKYPSISPYAYCAWNPVKLVDPDGRDVEIIKNEENKTVTIRANVYYNKNEIGVAADVFIEGFNNALKSWSNDIEKALTDGSLNAVEYKVDFNISVIECENPKDMANTDNVGNWISTLNDDKSNVLSRVIDNKNLQVDFNRNMFSSIEENPLFYGNDEYQGTLKHEIGHLFGLYDRYQRKNGEYATPIAKDLMSVDIPRNNAVEPFKRIWRSAGLEQSGSKAVIINKKNRELKN